jgi:hypothetical protein
MDLIRRIVICCLMVGGGLMAATTTALAAESGERRGEIGVQLGLRWVDRDIVPEDSDGIGVAPGIAAAWSLGPNWALFGDFNQSVQDSKLFCRYTDMCQAYTPESKIKVVTLGFERRCRPGPKGGRWVLGLVGGWIDVEWRGIQLHKGMLSIGFGRRMPLGPGWLRLWLRNETGIGIGTDRHLTGAINRLRMTNVTFLVGWEQGSGRDSDPIEPGCYTPGDAPRHRYQIFGSTASGPGQRRSTS